MFRGSLLDRYGARHALGFVRYADQLKLTGFFKRKGQGLGLPRIDLDIDIEIVHREGVEFGFGLKLECDLLSYGEGEFGRIEHVLAASAGVLKVDLYLVATT